MKVTYYEDEDTLVIRLSDKAITREVSQDWHTHVSYASDGTRGRDRHPGSGKAGRLAARSPARSRGLMWGPFHVHPDDSIAGRRAPVRLKARPHHCSGPISASRGK